MVSAHRTWRSGQCHLSFHVVVVVGGRKGACGAPCTPPMGLYLVFSEDLLGQCSNANNGIGSDRAGACRFRLSSVARSLVAKGKEKKDRNAGSPNRGDWIYGSRLFGV